MYSGDEYYGDEITSPLVQPQAPTLRDQILAATDRLNAIRRDYYQQRATYDDCASAARRVLELRREAERVHMGKVKTQITTRTIASLIRSP